MKRIDAANCTVDNHFQDGNPSTGLDATNLSSDFMNITQEEICSVITAAGLAVDQAHLYQGDPSGTNNNVAQLLQAIQLLIGGIAPAAAPFAVPNSAAGVPLATGLTLDPTKGKTARIPISVYRAYIDGTSTQQELMASGFLFCRYKPIATAWTVRAALWGDDCGLVFDASGNNVVLSNIDVYAGTAYTGTFNWGRGSYL